MRKLSVHPGIMLVALGACLSVGCSGLTQPEAAPAGGAAVEPAYLQARPADLQWFREAKFGLFVHWGPVSLKGTEIGWSRGGERRGRKGSGPIPAEEYDRLYQRFNPTQFNADEWVAIAQAAGMQYMVFTSKHHDGFCMFDSRLTGYKITNSPFKRDICAELAAACHRRGMRLGWYYSPVDWHHPDYRTTNHRRYVEYMHGQLRELCTNYGKVDIIWFDGLGGTAADWDSETLFKLIRGLQPHVLINNRAGLPADYDTPEQAIGRFQVDRPWESCITIGDQWAWKPNDRLKPMEASAEILVRTIGGDGNLLFNVGPMPTGRIEPRQVEILKSMGRWYETVAPALRRTRGGPFKPGPWGVSTSRGNTIYLHVLNWDEDVVRLPAIDARVVKAAVLGGGEAQIELRNSDGHINVHLARKLRHPVDTVIALELDRPAAELPPVQLESGSLATGKPATVGDAEQDKRNSPGNAVDDDYSTCWTARVTGKPLNLDVDLGRPQRVGRAVVCELLDPVQAFEVQYRQGEQWVSAANGTRIGARSKLDFGPVTAQHWRLSIVKDAGRRAQISEFQLFPPEE